MKRRLFKVSDIAVFVVLLFLALVFFLLKSNNKGEMVEVWVQGEMYQSFPLEKPFELELDFDVTIKGNGESAFFSHSDCPDKVCINTGKLSKEGEWAACLPNETVIKITGKKKSADTVS
ncbi:MAG: NusG domain II-containing protein [Ruminococcaceae bacterium]|nr:NusG domain II-containing protein [Oscillospiraceae bacterium]